MAKESFQQIRERQRLYHRSVFLTQEVPLFGLFWLSVAGFGISALKFAVTGFAEWPPHTNAAEFLLGLPTVSIFSYTALGNVQNHLVAYDREIAKQLQTNVVTKAS